MTKKLEDITTFVPFGYGMVGLVKSNDPATVDDPIIMFVHKKAVAGKFIDGEPVMKPREEKAMMKEVDSLIAMLNGNFNHKEDFVNVGDNYNQPRGPRKRRVNPVVDEKAKPEVVADTKGPPEPKVTRRAKTVAETPVEQPVVKRKYTRRQKVEAVQTPAEIVTADTMKREREMSSSHEIGAKSAKRVPGTNAKTPITDPNPTVRRTVRRKVEGKSRSGGSPTEVAVEVKRSRKRTITPNVVQDETKVRARKNVAEHA